MEKLLQSMSPPQGNRGVDWKQHRFLNPATPPPHPPTLCLCPSPSQASSSAPCHVQTQTAKVTVHHKAHYCLFSVSAMYWAASCLKQMGNCIFHSAAPTPRLCQAQFVCRHMWKIWNSGQHIEPVGSQAHRQVWRRLGKCRRTSSLAPLQKIKKRWTRQNHRRVWHSHSLFEVGCIRAVNSSNMSAVS